MPVTGDPVSALAQYLASSCLITAPYYRLFPDKSTQPQTGESAVGKDEVAEKQVAASGKQEVVEKFEQPTDEEVGEVCRELRRLSPDITINSSVRKTIHSFWHNVPVALARVKNAIASRWCKQPTGLFVQTLKNGLPDDLPAPVVAAKLISI